MMMSSSFGKAAETVGEMLREQIEYRELLATLARRDLTLRYKQTAMGFGWAICMPLLNTDGRNQQPC
jgi:ABC-type polysaccharide/polyol phosphate export permease